MAGAWPEEWYAGRWAEFPGWSHILGAAVDSVAAPRMDVVHAVIRVLDVKRGALHCVARVRAKRQQLA